MNYLNILPIELVREISLFLDIVDIIKLKDIVHSTVYEDDFFWKQYYRIKNKHQLTSLSKTDTYISDFISASENTYIDLSFYLIDEKFHFYFDMKNLRRIPKIGPFDSLKYYYVLHTYNTEIVMPYRIKTLLYITVIKRDDKYAVTIDINIEPQHKSDISNMIDASMYIEVNDDQIIVDKITWNEQQFNTFLRYLNT